ncbi:hypothetical protein [Marinobacterium weihaiense]|uniref:Uncharacterized protein n=1 Tax=Marinobacterium weihaiense TaxID=2851016 RepID=A0ABS6MBT1_9GAMM|nr:hypothetical protein [Marinobacterium weihaiense]MBV0933334.1 hypothetical protein [Marinobacterium weihaiense]
MTHVARYIVDSAAASRPVQTAAADCPQCNYSNNYYGDQVCCPQRR